MPAKTPRQQRFFGYLKSHPAEAAARGISPKVADEFAHKPAGGYSGKASTVKTKSAPKPHRNSVWGKF